MTLRYTHTIDNAPTRYSPSSWLLPPPVRSYGTSPCLDYTFSGRCAKIPSLRKNQSRWHTTGNPPDRESYVVGRVKPCSPAGNDTQSLVLAQTLFRFNPSNPSATDLEGQTSLRARHRQAGLPAWAGSVPARHGESAGVQKRSGVRQQVLKRECLKDPRQCGRRRSWCPRAVPRWSAAGFCLSF